jgi:guanidinopropionase
MTDTEFQPLDSAVVPRFAEPACFMRSPHVPLEGAEGLDIGLAGDQPEPGRHQPRSARRGAGLDMVGFRCAADAAR